jgi:CubicO group peptidase (beta-lactamase class C family)
MNRLPKVCLTVLMFASSAIPTLAQPAAPTDPQIKQRLASFVGDKKKPPGAAVGVIDENGTRVLTAGKNDAEGSPAISADTMFEIGSITKVFTATVLQDMVDHGEVSLDDPIGKFLPATVKTPSRKGKQITLLDLATQSSGLPRLPDNMSPMQLMSSNPYAEYGPDQLYAFLSSYKLKRDIGAEYEYSNLGVGLLGHILSLKAQTNYEDLVITRVCAPLKMASTRITLSPELKARLAPGHNASGKVVDNWDFKALAAAGALRSSVNDMLKFLAASMGTKNSGSAAVSATLARSEAARRDIGSGRHIGLAWHINTDGVIWHNGGTGGYRSFMGFQPKTGRGVVVLANSAGADTDSLGIWMLGPAKAHAMVKIDPASFDPCIGRYKLAPGVIITTTRDEAHFFAQLTGQEKFEIFPESETDFFFKIVDAQLTFHKDPAGKVTDVVLHQNGADQIAPREK